MTRIGNKIKSGYYPSQQPQTVYMKQLLEFSGDAIAIDTTCGTGEVLAYLTAQSENENGESANTVVTYGVEIDLARGELAKENLDNVIVAPIESCIISNDAVQFAYLNPPYLETIKNHTGKTERMEFIELERILRYLAPAGVLMYVIPYYRLGHERIARLLSTHFNKISVMRFTDENFDEFKQVVIIGHRKKNTYKEFCEKLYDTFMRIAKCDVDAIKKLLPTLQDHAENPEKRWVIPSTTASKLKRFETRLIDKSALAMVLSENGEMTRFVNKNRPKSVDLNGKTPPLPLAAGQISLLLAAGGINGLMGVKEENGSVIANPHDLHILRGQERVSKQVTEEKTETGVIYKTKTKREVAIKAILPTGEIKKFM